MCISNAAVPALLTTPTLPFKVPFPTVRLHQEPAICDSHHKPILGSAITIEPRGMRDHLAPLGHTSGCVPTGDSRGAARGYVHLVEAVVSVFVT